MNYSAHRNELYLILKLLILVLKYAQGVILLSVKVKSFQNIDASSAYIYSYRQPGCHAAMLLTACPFLTGNGTEDKTQRGSIDNHRGHFSPSLCFLLSHSLSGCPHTPSVKSQFLCLLSVSLALSWLEG